MVHRETLDEDKKKKKYNEPCNFVMRQTCICIRKQASRPDNVNHHLVKGQRQEMKQSGSAYWIKNAFYDT